MKGYLIDSNHLSEAVRRQSLIHARIKTTVGRGIRVGTCAPVLCEIEAGAINVRRPDLYHSGLRAVLRLVRLWPLTLQTAKLYGEIYHDLRSRGRALSQVDMMLAALCRELDLVLVTTDKDFAALSWLKTENWA